MIEIDPKNLIKIDENYQDGIPNIRYEHLEKVSISSSPRTKNMPQSYTPSQVSNQDLSEDNFRQKTPVLAYEAPSKSKNRPSIYKTPRIYNNENQKKRDHEIAENWGESWPDQKSQDQAMLELAIQQRFKNQDKAQSSASSGHARESSKKSPLENLRFLKGPLPDFSNSLIKEAEDKLPPFDFADRPNSPTKLVEQDPVQLYNGAIYVGQ